MKDAPSSQEEAAVLAKEAGLGLLHLLQGLELQGLGLGLGSVRERESYHVMRSRE